MKNEAKEIHLRMSPTSERDRNKTSHFSTRQDNITPCIDQHSPKIHTNHATYSHVNLNANSFASHGKRNLPIHRYASEEEFKKINHNMTNSQIFQPDLHASGGPTKGTKPSGHGNVHLKTENGLKKLKLSTQSKDEDEMPLSLTIARQRFIEKGGFQTGQDSSKKVLAQSGIKAQKCLLSPVSQFSAMGNLKETTSTTSADHLSSYTSKKSAPAFLKGKGKSNFNQNSQKSLIKSPLSPNSGSRNPNLSIENFVILKKLGEGKFGKVYLVKQIYSGFILAMKVIEKQKVIQDNLLEQFIRELKIQTFLNHPNIIKVFGFFQNQKYFYTLLELGSEGQLYNLMCSGSGKPKKITEEAVSFITKNLLEAVECMHHNKILHRDIKPENIVLIMGNVKICDFGWAANKIRKEELRSTYCGTPLYLSPEILKGYKYDEKVDIWAIGILAYELLIGSSPFEIYEQSDLYKIVFRLQFKMTDDISFPENGKIKVSKEFKEFIGAILNKNPKQRLSGSELLKLTFIRKYEGFETCEELCH